MMPMHVWACQCVPVALHLQVRCNVSAFLDFYIVAEQQSATQSLAHLYSALMHAHVAYKGIE
jgi:hypothetical protein